MSIDPSIFKAYDVRGIYPSQLNEDILYDIIQAYIAHIKPSTVVLGKDVRLSGPSLHKAATQAFLDSGVKVTDIGVVGADMLYFAVKKLGTDGGIFLSASHNPKNWNGINASKKGAQPISYESGWKDIQRLANKKVRVPSSTKGSVVRHDIVDEFATFVLSFIKPESITSKTIVANGNFGVSAKVFDSIVKKGNLPLRVIPLNENPDGSFPKGSPDLLRPENRIETSELIKKERADIGVAWDVDGDRCFIADEQGNFIEGYFITALLAKELLSRHPAGQKVIIDPRLIWASTKAITGAGGIPVIAPPGMTIIAERMQKEGALFAGEMSSHFYFRENANRDNGMIPLLLVLELMSREHSSLSNLVRPFTSKYFISGEINFSISDTASLLRHIESLYSKGEKTIIDGLSIEFPDWRFNLRASNTEPLVRLNVESTSKNLMEEKTAELKEHIAKFDHKSD